LKLDDLNRDRKKKERRKSVGKGKRDEGSQGQWGDLVKSRR